VLVSSLTSSVTSAVAAHGLWAVFALMLVDAVFPAGSELVMVYAGAVGTGAFAGARLTLFGHVFGRGFAGYLAAALAGTTGYLVGAAVGWLIGYVGWRPLLERHGGLLHLTPLRLDRADQWFARRGDLAVLIGRVTPVVRSFISIPAGLVRMPLRRYLVLSLLGSAAWAFALAGVGWGVGSGYRRFHSSFDLVTVAIVVVIVLAVVAAVRVRRRTAANLREE
jgi:membrane protein DedA with SNARE-associated domain